MTRKASSSTRRRVLTIAGSTALVSIAGCIGGSGDSGGDETTDGGMEDGTTEGGMEDGTTEGGMEDGTTEGGMEDGTTEGGMEDGTTEGGMEDGMEPTDPESAPRATVDRFGESAGTLHVRGPDDDLPRAGEPIDFDERFLVTGFGPGGQAVQYYDFDVMPTTPVPIYAFFDGDGDPVEGQRNVVGVVPGDDGYSDFWQVHTVTVPDGYRANTITSVEELQSTDYEITATDVVKNCPVVPDDSTASLRHDDDGSPTDLVEGWYDGRIVYYFLFEERSLEPVDGSVPLSPIYVTFNTNPGEDGGGPASGFMTEADGDRTHNVTATVPSDPAYSPLWDVNVYDNADFESVSDLQSALEAELLERSVAHVNCPVVSEN